jgi:hypothetical protein
MPFGSVNFEAGVDDKGERLIWLPRAVVDRLRSLRGAGLTLQRRYPRVVEVRLARRGCRSVIRITPSYGKLWFNARMR